MQKHKEPRKETSDDSFAASSPTPSYKPPSEHKQQSTQIMGHNDHKEKKSKYSKITEKYVQNAITDDTPHVLITKTVLIPSNNLGTVSSANHEEIIEQHQHQNANLESNKNIVGKSSTISMKNQSQINLENYQQSNFESESLVPSKSYAFSAKSKENHREIIESHLHNNHTSVQTNIRQPKQEQVKSYQEFASGVENENNPS
jgi:hypothetical protein